MCETISHPLYSAILLGDVFFGFKNPQSASCLHCLTSRLTSMSGTKPWMGALSPGYSCLFAFLRSGEHLSEVNHPKSQKGAYHADPCLQFELPNHTHPVGIVRHARSSSSPPPNGGDRGACGGPPTPGGHGYRGALRSATCGGHGYGGGRSKRRSAPSGEAWVGPMRPNDPEAELG